MSQAALEKVARRFGTPIRVNGVLCLSTNGDPALVEVFNALGWADPHPAHAVAIPPALEAATVVSPERAVLKPARGRLG